MAKLQDEIASAFLEKLAESPTVTPEMIDGLRKLLASTKKLKADDLVRVFAPRVGKEAK